MKVFEVKADERFDVVFRLAVCKTRKEMLSAIAADAKKEGGVDDSGSRTMGRFHPTPGVINNGIPGISYSGVFGTMYLNLADIAENDELVAHECAHAAFTRAFNIRHYTGTFNNDDDMDEQEEYCYFLGKAVAKVQKIIRNIKTGGGRKR